MPSSKKTDKAKGPGSDLPETQIDDVIGLGVKTQRMKLGLSLNDLCDRINGSTGLNWTAGTMSKIESGDRRVRVPELAVLCHALECSVRDLLDMDVPLSPPYAFWNPKRMAEAMTRPRNSKDEVSDEDTISAKEARQNRALRTRIADALELQVAPNFEQLGTEPNDNSTLLYYAPGSEESVYDLDQLVYSIFGDTIYGARENRMTELATERMRWTQEDELSESVERQLRAEATRWLMGVLARNIWPPEETNE